MRILIGLLIPSLLFGQQARTMTRSTTGFGDSSLVVTSDTLTSKTTFVTKAVSLAQIRKSLSKFAFDSLVSSGPARIASKVIAGVNNSVGYRLTQASGAEASLAIMNSSNKFVFDESAFGSIFSGAVTHSSTTTLSGALTYGGVTLSNAVTGTGNMVLSASPTLTGTPTVTTTGANAKIDITAATGTNATFIDFNNTGGTYYFGVDNSTGSVFGGSAYDAVVFTPAGKNIVLRPGGSAALTLNGTSLAATFGGAVSGITTLANTGTANLATSSGGFMVGSTAGNNRIQTSGTTFSVLNSGDANAVFTAGSFISTTGNASNAANQGVFDFVGGSGTRMLGYGTNSSTNGIIYGESRRSDGTNALTIWQSLVGGGITFPNVGTTASAANVFIDNAASNSLLRSTSSLKYKNWVGSMKPIEARRIVLELNQDGPVGRGAGWYYSKAKADNPNRLFMGFNAERGAEVEQALVQYDPQGNPDGFMYDRMTVPHNIMLGDHENRISELESIIKKQQKQIDYLLCVDSQHRTGKPLICIN